MAKKPPVMKEATRKRKRICLEVAERIIGYLGPKYGGYKEVDEVARIVETWLPLTYEEAEAAYEELDEECPVKETDPTKSLGYRLRQAVGIMDIDLKQAVESAIDQLNRLKGTCVQ